eukprot:1115262-Pyramimonas_sp.AAC.1
MQTPAFAILLLLLCFGLPVCSKRAACMGAFLAAPNARRLYRIARPLQGVRGPPPRRSSPPI